MTVRRSVCLFLLAAVTGIGWETRARSDSGAAQAAADPKAAMAELRVRLLNGSPSDFGVTPDGSVWGVLMETGYPEAAVTLVALADGNASLCFSTGGGVIGGAEHEAVRAAAKRFVHRAGDFTGAMEGDLGGGKHALSPLFYAGHEVITALREASEAPPR